MPFLHPDGRQIDAIYYRFINGGGLAVWLNENGDDQFGHTRAESGKRLVTTQPGECLLSRGNRYGPVESVRPYPWR